VRPLPSLSEGAYEYTRSTQRAPPIQSGCARALQTLIDSGDVIVHTCHTSPWRPRLFPGPIVFPLDASTPSRLGSVRVGVQHSQTPLCTHAHQHRFSVPTVCRRPVEQPSVSLSAASCLHRKMAATLHVGSPRAAPPASSAELLDTGEQVSAVLGTNIAWDALLTVDFRHLQTTLHAIVLRLRDHDAALRDRDAALRDRDAALRDRIATLEAAAARAVDHDAVRAMIAAAIAAAFPPSPSPSASAPASAPAPADPDPDEQRARAQAAAAVAALEHEMRALQKRAQAAEAALADVQKQLAQHLQTPHRPVDEPSQPAVVSDSTATASLVADVDELRRDVKALQVHAIQERARDIEHRLGRAASTVDRRTSFAAMASAASRSVSREVSTLFSPNASAIQIAIPEADDENAAASSASANQQQQQQSRPPAARTASTSTSVTAPVVLRRVSIARVRNGARESVPVDGSGNAVLEPGSQYTIVTDEIAPIPAAAFNEDASGPLVVPLEEMAPLDSTPQLAEDLNQLRADYSSVHDRFGTLLADAAHTAAVEAATSSRAKRNAAAHTTPVLTGNDLLPAASAAVSNIQKETSVRIIERLPAEDLSSIYQSLSAMMNRLGQLESALGSQSDNLALLAYARPTTVASPLSPPPVTLEPRDSGVSVSDFESHVMALRDLENRVQQTEIGTERNRQDVDRLEAQLKAVGQQASRSAASGAPPTVIDLSGLASRTDLKLLADRLATHERDTGDKFGSLQARAGRSEERLDELERRRASLDAALAALQQSLTQLGDKLAAGDTDRLSLWAFVRTVDQRVHELTEALGGLRRDLLPLQENSEAAAQLAKAVKALQAQSERVRERIETLTETKADKTTMQALVADLRRLVDSLQEGLTRRSGDSPPADLSARLMAMEAALRNDVQAHEEHLRQALQGVERVLEHKVEQRDFNSLKKVLEEKTSADGNKEVIEAAASKKRLVPMHCLSCDADVRLTKREVAPSIPVLAPYPPPESMPRPITVGTGVRARSPTHGYEVVMDALRPCGGAYTKTVAELSPAVDRRGGGTGARRAQQVLRTIDDVASASVEYELVAPNGHVYRGGGSFVASGGPRAVLPQVGATSDSRPSHAHSEHSPTQPSPTNRSPGHAHGSKAGELGARGGDSPPYAAV
jgi:phage FluMu protein gp41